MALLKKYEDNYILRALIELLPCGVGGFINSILVGYLNQVRQERLDAFFAELATGRLVLTEGEMQKEEDFLHRYLITVRAVLDTRRRMRLTRSGLYELFTGNYYGYTGGQGKTTPLLGKLLYLVDLK